MIKNIFKKDNLALDDEVVGVVYRTRDYSKFKFSKNNRTLNESQVARLVKSMAEKVITTIITVNDNMEIKDGQHRFRFDLIVFVVCLHLETIYHGDKIF